MKLASLILGMVFLGAVALGAQPSRGALVSSVSTQGAEAQSSYLLGDTDCDDDVDAVDALRILRHVAGLVPAAADPSCPGIDEPELGSLRGDVDCDHDIDAVDALSTLRLVVGLDVSDPCGLPTEPFPSSPDNVVIDQSIGAALMKDELLVALDLDAPSDFIREVAGAFEAEIIGAIPDVKVYQLRLEMGDPSKLGDLRNLILAYSPRVTGVSRSWLLETPSQYPNDPRFDSWNESSPSGNNWGLEFIHAPSAWDVVTGSSSVKVAIIDNDFDTTHEDLTGNLIKAEYWNSPRDGSGSGHGTHVAGTACASGDNHKGIAGVVWRCGLMVYNYAGASETLGDPSSVTYRMWQAAHDGARVVNMSWGFIDGNQCGSSYDEATRQRAVEMNSVLSRPVEWARDERHDVLWVIAAGNECRDARYQSPASLVETYPSNIITVASIGPNASLAPLSNYGSLVSVAAPGEQIWSTLPNNDYGLKSGTSMAAPHVTGLAALYLSHYPGATAADAKACIVGGAELAGRKVPSQPFYVIDAKAALDCRPRSSDVLAFVRNGDVWLLNPSTGVQRQLTNAGGVTDFQWSHSGGEIAYVDSATLYVQALDSSSAVQVSPGVTSFAWSPGFSLPFPSKLAYVTDRTLEVAYLPGSPAVTLAENVGSFVWAPDGTKIAFFSGDQSPAGLSMPAAKIGVVDFAGPPTYSDYTEPDPDMLKWSPNSAWVAYRIREDGAGSYPSEMIIVTSPTTFQRRVVTDSGAGWRWGDFIFDPEGIRLYASGARWSDCGSGGCSGIQLISAPVASDGNHEQFLAASAFGFVPYSLASAGSGEYVAFTTGSQMGACQSVQYGVLLDPHSGTLKAFSDGNWRGQGPDWYDWANHSDRLLVANSDDDYQGCIRLPPDYEPYLVRSSLSVVDLAGLSATELTSSGQKRIKSPTWSESDGFISYQVGNEVGLVDAYSGAVTMLGAVASPKWSP